MTFYMNFKTKITNFYFKFPGGVSPVRLRNGQGEIHLLSVQLNEVIGILVTASLRSEKSFDH